MILNDRNVKCDDCDSYVDRVSVDSFRCDKCKLEKDISEVYWDCSNDENACIHEHSSPYNEDDTHIYHQCFECGYSFMIAKD